MDSSSVKKKAKVLVGEFSLPCLGKCVDMITTNRTFVLDAVDGFHPPASKCQIASAFEEPRESAYG